jgi:LL-diaminopimelate aminotransferase
VPPYLFAEIRRKVAAARAAGKEVISLGIADPDHPTPDHIIDELVRAIRDEGDPDRHRYGGDIPVPAFPEAVAAWYQQRFGVTLPASDVVTTLGSKEAIAHLPLAYVNPGDTVLAPEPGYTVYHIGTVFCSGVTCFLPLVAENDFLPDLEAIPASVARNAKILWLNYPNNPTSATAPLEFLQKAVDYAREHNLLVVNDMAYSETTYDGYVAPSILQCEGAFDVALELGSLSKPYNMTGWRLGYAVGCPEAVDALRTVKDNLDSGVLRAIQFAGAKALTSSQECVAAMNAVYQRRRDLVVDTLNRLGWNLKKPQATFYIWAPVPEGEGTSIEFATKLLDQAGVVVTPGIGYGEHGEGYFRVALTYPDERLQTAMERIGKALG